MEITSFWPIFFFAIFFQGVFLSSILIANRKSNRGTTFLSILIILFSISIIDTVLYWTNYYLKNPHVLGLSLGFSLLYGPLFYMYLKRITGMKVDKIILSLIHFIPYFIVLLSNIPYYLSDSAEKLILIEEWNNSLINAIIVPFISLTSLVYYAVLSFNYVVKLEAQYGLKIIRSSHWLGLIFKSYSLFVLFNLIYFATVVLGRSSQVSDIIIIMGYSVFIYTIGYLGLKMSKLLNGIKVDTTKYRSALLPENFSREMFQKLNDHIATNKVYKNNEIKLAELANELSISAHQLSQIINQNSGQNFSEFINSYRVDEAIRLIGNIDRINILSYEVGFNNRTTFNKVFKKRTGLTPTEYKRKLEAGNLDS